MKKKNPNVAYLSDDQCRLIADALRTHIDGINSFLSDMDDGDDAPGPEADLAEAKALLESFTRFARGEGATLKVAVPDTITPNTKERT